MNTRSLNKEAQKNNNNNNPNIKPKTTKQCRICYGDDSTEDNPLIVYVTEMIQPRTTL